MPSVGACRSFYRCVQENRTVTDSRMKNLYPNLQNLTHQSPQPLQRKRTSGRPVGLTARLLTRL